MQDKVKIAEPVTLDQLPDEANEPPAAGILGLNAEGSAGSDSFDLIGRKGARELLATDANSMAHFTRQVQKQIQQALERDEEIRRHEYTVLINVWVAFDGTLERTELLGTTGRRGVDERIETAIASVPRLTTPPPPDAPMPIRLRITARM